MKVYVLESALDQSQYVGMSADPDRRLLEHNAGKVKSTKAKRPWRIIHLESFENRIDLDAEQPKSTGGNTDIITLDSRINL